MKNIISVLIFVLLFLISSRIYSESSKGMQYIEKGDIDNALAEYKIVLSKNPIDTEANLFYGLFLYIDILNDPLFKSYVGKSGIKKFPDTLKGLMEYLKDTMSDDSELWQKFFTDPQYAVEHKQFINNLFEKILIPYFEKSLKAFDIVEKDKKFSLKINYDVMRKNLDSLPSIDKDKVTIDNTEVYFADAVISFLCGSFYASIATDFELDMDKMNAMISNSSEKNMEYFYNPFGDKKYPNFGKLKANGKEYYAKAKNLYIRSTTKLQLALSNMYSPSYKSEEHFVDKIEKYINKIAQFGIQFFIGSLKDSTGQSLINIGKFLDNTPSLRDLLPIMDNNGEPRLYDRLSNEVKTPVKGDAYYVRFTNLTFSGFLSIPYNEELEYIPAILDYNTAYTPMGNLMLNINDFGSHVWEGLSLTGNYKKHFEYKVTINKTKELIGDVSNVVAINKAKLKNKISSSDLNKIIKDYNKGINKVFDKYKENSEALGYELCDGAMDLCKQKLLESVEILYNDIDDLEKKMNKMTKDYSKADKKQIAEDIIKMFDNTLNSLSSYEILNSLIYEVKGLNQYK